MASVEPFEGAISRYEWLRRRTYEVLAVARAGDRLSRAVDVSLIVLIVANILAVMIETVESINQTWGHALKHFEYFSVAVFSVEYLLRIWSITADKDHAQPFRGRLRFATEPFTLVDLLAVAPFYMTALFTVDLRTLRALRLIRLVRTLKIGRYSESLRSLGQVLLAKRGELLTTLFAVAILLVMSSTVMYYVEREQQPELFSSIPAAMWWGVETLTTIGYGDMYPMTPVGRLLAAFVAVLGVGLFALPAGIIGSGFVEQMREKSRKPATCPHCGKEIAPDVGAK